MPRLPDGVPTVPVDDDAQPREPRNTPPPPPADDSIDNVLEDAQAAREEKRKRRSPADKKLATSISSAYETAGVAMVTIGIARNGDERFLVSGNSMVENSQELADAWMQVANDNPKVKAALKKFSETSAVGSLIGLHIAIGMPFLKSLIPANVAAFMPTTQTVAG